VCDKKIKDKERDKRGRRSGYLGGDTTTLDDAIAEIESNKSKLVGEQKILDELDRIITAYNKKNPSHIQQKKTFEVKQYDRVAPEVYGSIYSDPSASSAPSEAVVRIKDYLKCIIPYRFKEIDETNNKLDFDVTLTGILSDEPGLGAGVDAALTPAERQTAADEGRGRGEIEIQEGHYNPRTLATAIGQAFAKNDFGTLNIKFDAETRKYKWNWVPRPAPDGTQRNLRLTLRIVNDNTDLRNMIGFETGPPDIDPFNDNNRCQSSKCIF